ncbi:MAG: DsrE/DsrF/DrsH-like family protein [Proteobacteria bacterium]|nr:DsrE/DsrF/DrsH-like family protein [Pseudomonadota bacterium]MBU1688551.1 DsrE/DsrF/DrsH-like family protein [Pseudomonadota bacterium]
MANKKATILLQSGELDKALSAFIFANGYASLGIEVKMWFMIWGYNCLKKRKSWFSFRRKYDPVRESGYRVLETDNILQPMVEMLNRGGVNHLPMSRLNLLGLGPILFNKMLKRKGIMGLEELIRSAEDLGVKFKMCQICFDALGISVDDLIVPNVEVKGVAEYARDTMEAHVNLFI